MSVLSAVHVKMEERVLTSREATSVHVMRNILGKTVKQVRYMNKLNSINRASTYLHAQAIKFVCIVI